MAKAESQVKEVAELVAAVIACTLLAFPEGSQETPDEQAIKALRYYAKQLYCALYMHGAPQC